MHNDSNTFLEIASILCLSTLFGILGQRLRQPLIIMFLAAGILAGPSCLGVIQSYEQIELLSHIGIALLLFIVGLRLDINLIRKIGKVALATGLGQIIFTSLIGFLIAITLKMPLLTAAYVSVALTFSSTIIVVKLLSDKREIDSLYGQIAIGFLIVQDIAAIIGLIALTSFGDSVSHGYTFYKSLLLFFGKGLGIIIVLAFLMTYVIPMLMRRLAHSSELLTLFAIAWAIFLAATGGSLGFTREVGAFLAGVSLASTEYRDSIGSRLSSIRDFLLLFFFIQLGARLEWTAVGSQIGSSILFSAFILVGNPLIVLAIMGFMGYRRRTGFLAGLTVAQISEFSLILCAVGVSLGHIDSKIMGFITMVGVVTIFLSTYMILYSGELYIFFSKALKIFERKNPFREPEIDSSLAKNEIDVILIGLGTYGSGLLKFLNQQEKKILGIDFDPEILNKWKKEGIFVVYGDITDPDIYDQLPFAKTKWVVSTIRSERINLLLASNIHKKGYPCKMAFSAQNKNEAETFKEAGVHLIFRPFEDATEQAVDLLNNAMDYLPESVDWPLSFCEIRIRADAGVAGKMIRELSLRTLCGVSIIAISRGHRVYFDPAPEFCIYPGDRLLLTGMSNGIKMAEEVLNRHDGKDTVNNTEIFDIAEIKISDRSGLSGKTVAESCFRQKYGVTIVGIKREKSQITSVSPMEILLEGDTLVVIGVSSAIHNLKKLSTL